jgi:hypothetical protein
MWTKKIWRSRKGRSGEKEREKEIEKKKKEDVLKIKQMDDKRIMIQSRNEEEQKGLWWLPSGAPRTHSYTVSNLRNKYQLTIATGSRDEIANKLVLPLASLDAMFPARLQISCLYLEHFPPCHVSIGRKKTERFNDCI